MPPHAREARLYSCHPKPYPVTMRVLAMLLGCWLVGCSLQTGGLEHKLDATLLGECGWKPTAGQPRLSLDGWVRADAEPGCGYLPDGVSPCDMAPVSSWTNDGTPIRSWTRPGAKCEFPFVKP